MPNPHKYPIQNPQDPHDKLLRRALDLHAKEIDADVSAEPTVVPRGEQFVFLIWPDDPCIYYDEGANETGRGIRIWVEHYATTGEKLGGQFDAEEFKVALRRDNFLKDFFHQTGQLPTPAQIEAA